MVVYGCKGLTPLPVFYSFFLSFRPASAGYFCMDGIRRGWYNTDMYRPDIIKTTGQGHIDHMTRIYRDFAITALQMLVDDIKEGPGGKHYRDALDALDDDPIFTLLEIADIRPDCFFDRIDEVLERQAHGENCMPAVRRYRLSSGNSKRIRRNKK